MIRTSVHIVMSSKKIDIVMSEGHPDLLDARSPRTKRTIAANKRKSDERRKSDEKKGH